MTSTIVLTLPGAIAGPSPTIQTTTLITLLFTAGPDSSPQVFTSAISSSSTLTGATTSSSAVPSSSQNSLNTEVATTSVPSAGSGKGGNATSIPATTASVTTTPSASVGGISQDNRLSDYQKHVVTGSLCGAIAGLLLGGLLIFLILRCRRRKHQHDPESMRSNDEKKSTTGFIERWSGKIKGIAAGTPATSTVIPTKRGRHAHDSNTSSVTVDEDHHIIRMSTHHWPRPYARGESYRDSLPPGALRVMNPDRSLPPTPRDSTDDLQSVIAGGGHGGTGSLRAFLRKNKPLLASDGALGSSAGGAGHTGFSPYSLPRSRASSRSFLSTTLHSHSQSHNHIRAQDIPTITINPSLSLDCIPSAYGTLPGGATTNNDSAVKAPRGSQSAISKAGSFISYPSLASLRTIGQKPPEDPFYFPATSKEGPNAGVLDLSTSRKAHIPPGSSHTLPLPRASFAKAGQTHQSHDQYRPSRPRRPSLASTVDSARTRLGSLFTQPFHRSTASAAAMVDTTSLFSRNLSETVLSDDTQGDQAASQRSDSSRKRERAQSHGNYDLSPPVRRGTGGVMSLWNSGSGFFSAATHDIEKNGSRSNISFWARAPDRSDIDRTSLRGTAKDVAVNEKDGGSALGPRPPATAGGGTREDLSQENAEGESDQPVAHQAIFKENQARSTENEGHQFDSSDADDEEHTGFPNDKEVEHGGWIPPPILRSEAIPLPPTPPPPTPPPKPLAMRVTTVALVKPDETEVESTAGTRSVADGLVHPIARPSGGP